MILDGFIALLQQSTSVSANVADRVYKLVLPRGYTLPAIVVHRYGGSQDYDYAGPVSVREDQIQIDVYGNTPNACDTATESVRSLLDGYTGTLPGGAVVQGCYLERDMDMPFMPNADAKGIANRAVLGYRVVSER